MSGPLATLLSTNLRTWLGSKGFWLVAAAALFPLVLTGAWMATHQADVSAVDITWSPAAPAEGENVTFTATVRNVGSSPAGPFNATISVGTVTGNRLVPEGQQATEVRRLQPGESDTITLSWVARAGNFWALVDADTDDKVGEVEEFNNQVPKPIRVAVKAPTESGPRAPSELAGPANATGSADLALASLEWSPAELEVGKEATFTATVQNRGPDAVADVPVVVRVGRLVGERFVPFKESSERVTLEAGGSRTVTLTWNAVQGAYWADATVNLTANANVTARDPDTGNNWLSRGIAVQPTPAADAQPPPPPEKLTIKDFYINVLSFLHLRILIPFVALFYAAGVLADAREQGTLPYVLTRPVPRWMLPMAQFLAGFAVAALAVAVGVLATFALLFGAPGSDVGFLTTPLLAGLISLFVYGAFFVLLGTLVDRPYLVGVAIVLGWETLAALFVPWVRNLTIGQHLLNALQGWRLDAGVQLLPEGADATRAFWLVLIAGLAFLGAAAYVMRKREFDV